MEVEHVKAHRTKKEQNEMSHFEKFVAEGNEQKSRSNVGRMVYGGSFDFLVEECKDCEELKPKPKENWVSEDKKKRRRNIERNGARKPTRIRA